MTIIQPLAVPGVYTILQAVALGVLPMNALLASVNGVAVGAGAPCPTVAQILSGGTSGFSVFGPNVLPSNANPANGEQIAPAGGVQNATSNLVGAPITGNTLCAGLVFSTGSQYGGF